MELAYWGLMLTRSQTQIRPTDYLLNYTTILIVDDEPGPRESLKMILSPAHKVITCASGAEALEALATSSVDVVTIDLNMPSMKGDELMRRIRSEFPQVEIIIITGCGTVRTAVEGLRYLFGALREHLLASLQMPFVAGVSHHERDRHLRKGRGGHLQPFGGDQAVHITSERGIPALVQYLQPAASGAGPRVLLADPPQTRPVLARFRSRRIGFGR